MKEIWIKVPGAERYEVSNLGEVRSLSYRNTGEVRKLTPVKRGKYYRVGLWYDGEYKHRSISHLVWEAFNGPIPRGMQVNHIDENPANNRLDNLNLMTPKENSNWGTRNERSAEHRINHPDKSKTVEQIDPQGNVVGVYQSVMEASRTTGIHFGNICSVCRGERNVAGGYKWKYVEHEDCFT